MAESDRKKVMYAFKKAIGSTGITECTYKRVEGYSDTTWVHIKIKYIYGTGKTHLFYGALDDITEQKNSEIKKDLQMDEQRKLIEYIYENIPCGMAHFELDGGFKFKTANKAAMKMFGFTKEDLDKKDIYWDNFVDNEYLNIALVKVKELEHLPEEAGLNLEYPITSNGETKWIRDFTQLFNKNSGGKIYHAVFTDITEQKRLEQELENLKQSAKLS